jgi:hypothetical protein
MCDRGDLDQEFRPHEVGADAVAGRRMLREIFPVNLVHSGVRGRIGKEDVIEGNVLERAAGRFNYRFDRFENVPGLRLAISRRPSAFAACFAAP